MIADFKTLYELDIKDYLDHKEVTVNRDGKWSKEQLGYLNWATCIKLLYLNGAEKVEFIPILNENGHSMFVYDNGKDIIKKETDKRKFNAYAPEVRVKVVVDDKSAEFVYPLINGTEVLEMGVINQQLVNTSRQRAFVKGVAILTGLGLSLWEKNDETEDKKQGDDLSLHSIYKIKNRVETLVTSKLHKYSDMDSLCKELNVSQKQFATLLSYYEKLGAFEKAVEKL